jgi:Putative metal-binding motif
MTARATLLPLALLLATCKLYNPEVVDCSIRCATDGTCPLDTVCKEGFCRIPNSTNRCDCRPGEDRPCGGGKGECNPGIQRCDSSGTWSACLGEGKPTQEKCDNKDNNCDGLIDNDVASPPSCSRTFGVCAQITQVCKDGTFVDCTAADYGLDFEPVETKCDGLDNDCDGVVDGTPDKGIATGVVGNWELFGTPSGFALVTATTSSMAGKLDLKVTRFDQALVKTGSVTLATVDSSVALRARNDGEDVFVVWNVGGRFEVRVVSASGTVSSLASPQGIVGSDFQLGLSSTQLVVGYQGPLANSNSAREVIWARDGGTVLRNQEFNIGPDGGPTADVYGVLVSRGGKYVAFRGDVPKTLEDGGADTSTETVYGVYDIDGNLQSTAYPGPSDSALIEMGSKLASFYDDQFTSFIFLFPSYSVISIIPNILPPVGATIVVRTSTDPTVYIASHAASTSAGVSLAYLDNANGRLGLASYTPAGVQRSMAVFSDAGVGIPRVASNGSQYLGLAFQSNGTVFARRICSP